MKIKWYGHACFSIEGDDTVIVTDPYTPEVAGLEHRKFVKCWSFDSSSRV